MVSADKAARLYRDGLAAYREGRYDQALRSLRRALELEPANADRRYDLAVVLQESRRHADAAAEYRRVLRMRGEAVDALSNLALCLLALGELAEAERFAGRAVALAPASPRALQNLGVIERARGAASRAVATLKRAAELQPGSAAIWNDLGEAHLAASEYRDAERCFARALELDGRHGPAQSNLGLALAVNGRPAAGEAVLRHRLADDPADPAALDALAVTLSLEARYEEALAAARASVAREPDAKYLVTLGWVQQARGATDDAVSAFRQALERDPQSASARFGLANALLALGRFAEGWRAFLARPGKRVVPAVTAAPLSSHDLGRIHGRRVTLVGDHGIGDELFFLRFAAPLRAAGARLAYWGDPRLQAMLGRTGLFEEVGAYGHEVPGADFAAHAGDLPAILGDREALPRPPPVRLAPARDCLERMRKVLAESGPPPYIGVTWQAGLPADRFDALRTRLLYKRIDPLALAAALGGSGGTVVVVQRAPTAADRAAFGPRAADLSAANEDLEDMLALMALLDDYVGVSNTNMHLRAGAGRTARVLVPMPPEWRWQAATGDSPWFPGFATYRQAPGGRWAEALARLAGDLAASVPD
jgi:tetratricopeptide (TPR) repeat protein